MPVLSIGGEPGLEVARKLSQIATGKLKPTELGPGYFIADDGTVRESYVDWCSLDNVTSPPQHLLAEYRRSNSQESVGKDDVAHDDDIWPPPRQRHVVEGNARGQAIIER